MLKACSAAVKHIQRPWVHFHNIYIYILCIYIYIYHIQTGHADGCHTLGHGASSAEALVSLLAVTSPCKPGAQLIHVHHLLRRKKHGCVCFYCCLELQLQLQTLAILLPNVSEDNEWTSQFFHRLGPFKHGPSLSQHGLQLRAESSRGSLAKLQSASRGGERHHGHDWAFRCYLSCSFSRWSRKHRSATVGALATGVMSHPDRRLSGPGGPEPRSRSAPGPVWSKYFPLPRKGVECIDMWTCLFRKKHPPCKKRSLCLMFNQSKLFCSCCTLVKLRRALAFDMSPRLLAQRKEHLQAGFGIPGV